MAFVTNLYAGTLDDFNDSMAQDIELALATLLGPLPPAPEQLVRDRRALCIAIANGVINHLKRKQAALEVRHDFGFGDIVFTTDIKVRT
jgi:hypothetical protein